MMMILKTLKTVIQAINPILENYTQFTIDFIEELEQRTAHKDSMASIHYDVDNILEIMKPGLKDAEFFETIKFLTNLK